MGVTIIEQLSATILGLAGFVATWVLARKTVNLQRGLIQAQTTNEDMSSLEIALTNIDHLSKRLDRVDGQLNACQEDNHHKERELREVQNKLDVVEQALAAKEDRFQAYVIESKALRLAQGQQINKLEDQVAEQQGVLQSALASARSCEERWLQHEQTHKE